MNSYLIVNSNSKDLETIIFSGEGGDVVAVFTELKRAEQYIDEAKWGSEFTVASLEPIDFLEWLIHCYRNGVRFMATNPDRRTQMSGQEIDTLEIEKQLEYAVERLNVPAENAA